MQPADDMFDHDDRHLQDYLAAAPAVPNNYGWRFLAKGPIEPLHGSATYQYKVPQYRLDVNAQPQHARRAPLGCRAFTLEKVQASLPCPVNATPRSTVLR